MTFLALLLVLAFFCGCLVLVHCIATCKCWSRINKRMALERYAERWRSIGP